jgi:protein-S-isoprenylcysteine O-methyltransferase Ste14
LKLNNIQEKERLTDAVGEIEFNQNLRLQKASARYQMLLSILITLFAFSLGLLFEGNSYGRVLAIVTAVIIIIVYIAFEREFGTSGTSMKITYKNIKALKRNLNKPKSRK